MSLCANSRIIVGRGSRPVHPEPAEGNSQKDQPRHKFCKFKVALQFAARLEKLSSRLP